MTLPLGVVDDMLAEMRAIQAEESIDRVGCMLYVRGRQMDPGDARRYWRRLQDEAHGGTAPRRRVDTRSAAAAVGIGFSIGAQGKAGDGPKEKRADGIGSAESAREAQRGRPEETDPASEERNGG